MDRIERSVFRILEDYERAAQISPIVLDELRMRGIDLAARKNAPVVEELRRKPVPASPKEAVNIVPVALETDRRRKQASRQATKRKTPEEFVRQINSLFTKRYAGMPRETVQAEMKKVLLGIAESRGSDIVLPGVLRRSRRGRRKQVDFDYNLIDLRVPCGQTAARHWLPVWRLPLRLRIRHRCRCRAIIRSLDSSPEPFETRAEVLPLSP